MTDSERRNNRYIRRKAKRQEKIPDKTFDDVFSWTTLCKAGINCCKGTRWKTSTINFEQEITRNATIKMHELNENTYKFQGFCNFTKVERGHERDINALAINDRMVQKAFCDEYMTKAFSRRYIYDNYASLQDKGITFAIKRLKVFLRKHYAQYGQNGGILQLDYKHYFASLPHEKLKERAKQLIQDDKLSDFLCQCIDDFQNMPILGKNEYGYYGIGLGSQVSQNLALEYVNPIDHYIKEKLGIKYYGRYMDDCFIISDSLEELYKIKEFLFDYVKQYQLELHERKCKIIPFKGNSFTFLKFRFTLTDTGKVLVKPNRGNIKSMRKKIFYFKRWYDEGTMEFTDIIGSYQSWRSCIIRSNCYKTLVNMDTLFYEIFHDEVDDIINNKKWNIKLYNVKNCFNGENNKSGKKNKNDSNNSKNNNENKNNKKGNDKTNKNSNTDNISNNNNKNNKNMDKHMKKTEKLFNNFMKKENKYIKELKKNKKKNKNNKSNKTNKNSKDNNENNSSRNNIRDLKKTGNKDKFRKNYKTNKNNWDNNSNNNSNSKIKI